MLIVRRGMVLKGCLLCGRQRRCVPQQSVGVILPGQALAQQLRTVAATVEHRERRDEK